MPSNREIGEHLLSCFDTVYRVLGESAPTLSNDTYVVRTHEMSRAFGSVALELRGQLDGPEVAPLPVLEAVLRHSVASDETGAMVLFAMTMEVGPRLLVSLLDARRALTDETLRQFCDSAADAVVVEIRKTGESARNQAPIDDPSWQLAARDVTETLDSAGFVESLGISR
jgi:hypothetical protein